MMDPQAVVFPGYGHQSIGALEGVIRYQHICDRHLSSTFVNVFRTDVLISK